MGKLIKYEWKKQRTSRMVIIGLLAAGILACWCGLIFRMESVLGFSIVFLYLFSILALFYTGIECVLIFNRDLRTKQSYMLFMVPKSIWSILGAKFISAVLEMLFVFVLFLAAGSLSLMAAVWYSGKIEAVLEVIKEFVHMTAHANIDWGMLLEAAVLIFSGWILVILIGFFAVILARTVLIKSKFAGLFAFILFCAVNFVVERGYYFVEMLPETGIRGYFGLDIWYVCYYILVYAVLFMASGWLAERKLSV